MSEKQAEQAVAVNKEVKEGLLNLCREKMEKSEFIIKRFLDFLAGFWDIINEPSGSRIVFGNGLKMEQRALAEDIQETHKNSSLNIKN